MPSKRARPIYRKKRFWLGLVLLAGIAWLLAQRPVRIMLQTAPNSPRGAAAQPVIDSVSLSDWQTESIRLQRAFETEVYGRVPMDLQIEEISRQTLDGPFFEGSAQVETRQFRLTNPDNGLHREFGLVIVTPLGLEGEIPIIVSQNFCPNHNVVPVEGVPVPDVTGFDCSGESMMSNVFLYFFGRYITTPPLKEIMERGYAFAAMYPSEFVPDSATWGRTILDTVFDTDPKDTRPGALAAWAAQFSLVSDYLETDARFSHSITYGHSRYGKTGLIAAAYNPNIDAVLSHQSGTGGASLSRNKPGETIADITSGYPHWFGGNYTSYADDQSAMPIDQHQLLAMIAPRPVLIGNAKRDVWSDPNGAFRAANAASPAYQIYDSEGLTAQKLNRFRPADDLSFWIRPGTHGVVKEDWPAFLDFLDKHFK